MDSLLGTNEDPSNAVVKRTCHGSAWTSEDVAGMPMHRLAFAECNYVKNSNYSFTGEFVYSTGILSKGRA